MSSNSTVNKVLIYSLVFFAGFANLATEIIGPRLIASLFGSTTITWAIIISVTLIGISVGYFLGGRVARERVLMFLPGILILNAIWLLAISWLIWEISVRVAGFGYLAIAGIAILAFFLPAVLFSMVSPLAISLRTAEHPAGSVTREVGNIYAVGTLGSVIGALMAAFILIPRVGLSNSLKLFAIGAVLFAILLLSPKTRLLGLAALILAILFPFPNYRWGEDFNSVLLAQREGYYQTIRVYTDNSTYVRMDLGPTFQTRMSLTDGEPLLGYAVEMVKAAGDVRGKRVLIIGGAGHTQARALEKRGASVVEVEIDPFVIQMSDRYFGTIHGQVIALDGRTYLETSPGGSFDFIFIDAFDGLASIPVQLTTREFFESVSKALKPKGRLIYNFIGIPAGARSNSFHALSATMASVFLDTRASLVAGEDLSNVILMASQARMVDVDYPQAPKDGTVLSDDLNPVEIYFEQARSVLYTR
jgi:spermidine synthase